MNILLKVFDIPGSSLCFGDSKMDRRKGPRGADTLVGKMEDQQVSKKGSESYEENT